MYQDLECPMCKGTNTWRDNVDNGIGYVYGPWHCSDCGWNELYPLTIKEVIKALIVRFKRSVNKLKGE